MIERLRAGRFNRLRLHHVRMAFSTDIAELGEPSVRKARHLVHVVQTIARVRRATGARLLYYPPAAAGRWALYRDIAILLLTRGWFERTVYHFHAGGLAALVSRLTPPERRMFHAAFDEPECAILLSELNPPDAALVAAKRTEVVPYGIEDVAPQFGARSRQNPVPTILYVGMLVESKGVLVLLQACHRLRKRGIAFRLRMVGGFGPASIEPLVRQSLVQWDLSDVVDMVGVTIGSDKWLAYREADVLCFPTHYELETFGLVALEAMQFSLPVVATQWRALPSIVRDGETGILIPARDPDACAKALEQLLTNPGLRVAMGSAGRRRFVDEFTIDRWYRRMEHVLSIAAGLHD